MALSFAAGASKPDERRRKSRGRIIQVRRTIEDVTQKDFDTAFAPLLEVFIRDSTVGANLAQERERIPYSNKRLNQTYLAAGLVLWHLLGRPTYKKLIKIDAKTYHQSADAILLSITNLSKKSLSDATIQPEESTLYRYVSDIATSIEFVNSVNKND